MRHVACGAVEIAYLEIGPAKGVATILLHGFPYDVHAFDSAAERLASAGYRCIVPYLRGFGETRLLSENAPRSGQQAALGADLLALLDALAIPRAILAGFDWGGRAACIVACLWPDRVRALVSCGTGYNIQDIAKASAPAHPEQEYRSWYGTYFNLERGRAGLAEHRRDLAKLLWKLWSPSWQFDDETFARTAAAFDNPDFVEIVIHSYRHRLGNAPGDPVYDAIEAVLAQQPAITVPSIVLRGADDGVEGPASDTDTDKPHFSSFYQKRILAGVGHNPPQEDPGSFADAIMTLAERSQELTP